MLPAPLLVSLKHNNLSIYYCFPFHYRAWASPLMFCVSKRKACLTNLLCWRTLAEHIDGLSHNISEQLQNKAQSFTTIYVVFDERTDSAQLDIFIRGVNDRIEVTGVCVRFI